MEIGYKVLTLRRHSIIQYPRDGGIYYPVLKKVKPQVGYGPLCLFESYEMADMFRLDAASYHALGRIVKCRYEKSLENSIWSCDNIYNGKAVKIYISTLPRGTILADSVTCLE